MPEGAFPMAAASIEKTDSVPPLRFADAPMFEAVMCQNVDICRRMLELILDQPIDRVENVTTEMTINPALGARGIRMDAFVKAKDAVYDIEMQTTRYSHLGRRVRYYQSAIDTQILDKNNSYAMLPETIIIFICTYDPLGEGRPVYTLDVICRESPDVAFDHGFKWLLLNAAAYDRADSESLRSLLQYISTGIVVSGDGLVQDIDSAVEDNNRNEQWRREARNMLTWQESIELEMQYRLEEVERIEKMARETEARARAHEEQTLSRIALLTERLQAANRLDEAIAAMTDQALRERLFSEFDLD